MPTPALGFCHGTDPHLFGKVTEAQRGEGRVLGGRRAAASFAHEPASTNWNRL